jgi:hypothetical protein
MTSEKNILLMRHEQDMAMPWSERPSVEAQQENTARNSEENSRP